LGVAERQVVVSDLSWPRGARNAAFNVLTGGRITKLEEKRDKALAERDAAVAERDQALAERDAAVAERDQALSERDAAVAERDQALSERDAAVAERDILAAKLRALQIDLEDLQNRFADSQVHRQKAEELLTIICAKLREAEGMPSIN